MNEIFTFMRGMVPTQIEVQLGVIVSMIGTAFSYTYGWNDLLQALMVAMVLDYISGVLAAYISPELALNSQKGFRGIGKKVMILVLVSLSYQIDHLMNQPMVYTVVVWFYLGNEGLSIIENAAKAGVPVPEKLKDTLEQLSSEKKERTK